VYFRSQGVAPGTTGETKMTNTTKFEGHDRDDLAVYSNALGASHAAPVVAGPSVVLVQGNRVIHSPTLNLDRAKLAQAYADSALVAKLCGL
jgi:hypothetical protein